MRAVRHLKASFERCGNYCFFGPSFMMVFVECGGQPGFITLGHTAAPSLNIDIFSVCGGWLGEQQRSTTIYLNKTNHSSQRIFRVRVTHG